jgi:hypothetical protein
MPGENVTFSNGLTFTASNRAIGLGVVGIGGKP